MMDCRKMSNGVREKALQFLREVPRISQSNIQQLPGTKRVRKRGYGQMGKERGWGSSARQKMHYAPLGYESGSTPIQRKTAFERSYNYGIHAVKQFPPISLHQLQLAIDTSKRLCSTPFKVSLIIKFINTTFFRSVIKTPNV